MHLKSRCRCPVNFPGTSPDLPLLPNTIRTSSLTKVAIADNIL